MKEISDVKEKQEIANDRLTDIKIKSLIDEPLPFADKMFDKLCDAINGQTEDIKERASFDVSEKQNVIEDRVDSTGEPFVKKADDIFSSLEKKFDTEEINNQRHKSITPDGGNKIEYGDQISEFQKVKAEGVTQKQRELMKAETGWSDKIVDYINNKWQYEILKSAGLKEVEINGRPCLIKENIDLDYTDADGISNRDRIERGLAPLDSKTGKPLELHHLGQKIDSPLVELTVEEHRTGEFKEGIKNQRINHETNYRAEVHVDGNNWSQERGAHWKARAEQLL